MRVEFQLTWRRCRVISKWDRQIRCIFSMSLLSNWILKRASWSREDPPGLNPEPKLRFAPLINEVIQINKNANLTVVKIKVYLGPGWFGLFNERPRLLSARNFSAAFIRVLQNRSLDEALNMLVGSDGIELLLPGRVLVPGVSASLVSARLLWPINPELAFNSSSAARWRSSW